MDLFVVSRGDDDDARTARSTCEGFEQFVDEMEMANVIRREMHLDVVF